MAKNKATARKGGDGKEAPDPEAPELRTLIEEAVARAVAELEDEKRQLAKQLKAGEGRAAELEGLVQGRDEQLARLAIDGAIRAAAAEATLVPAAMEDALARGRGVFVLDEDGAPVARDAEGKVVTGADGETPLTPAEWLESMRDAAPHWWPPSSGADRCGFPVGEIALRPGTGS